MAKNIKVKKVAIYDYGVYQQTNPENTRTDFENANDIYKVMNKIFSSDPEVTSIRFVVIDDEYLKYIEKNGYENNPDARKTYIQALSTQTLDLLWKKHNVGENVSLYFLPVKVTMANIPSDGRLSMQMELDSVRRIERKIESTNKLEKGSVRIVDTVFTIDDFNQYPELRSDVTEMAINAFHESGPILAEKYYEHDVPTEEKSFYALMLISHRIYVEREVTREFFDDYVVSRKILTNNLDTEFVGKHLERGLQMSAEMVGSRVVTAEEAVQTIQIAAEMEGL